MRVPDAAGNGKARITVSYSDWKEGKVSPITFEMPIVETKPKSNSKNRFKRIERNPEKGTSRERNGGKS